MQEAKHFEVDDLRLACIRAQDFKTGKWGSYTFRELIDGGKIEQIESWFFKKLIELLREKDLREGNLCSDEDYVINICRLHEHLIGRLVKLKKEPFRP